MNTILKQLIVGFALAVLTTRAEQPFADGLIEPSPEQKATFMALSKEYEAPVTTLASELPSRVVNAAYLPPVANGNQGQLGICGSICITYFTATHQLAKARGWSAPGHNGDWSKVTSPAWGVLALPHATKNGQPNGANPLGVINEIIRSGIRNWQDYPYSDQMDYSVQPDFGARAAALHWRAKSAVRIGDVHSASGIMSLKHLLAGGDVAATTTDYVAVLKTPAAPDVQSNGVIVRRGTGAAPGHALTIVGYDDSMSYTDPDTGAVEHGAFLLVNSWGTSWGYSVPEVGTGGFIWVPYKLTGFLNGAYSLYFPSADTVPELYGKMEMTDYDGNWISQGMAMSYWNQRCKYTLPGEYEETLPEFNDYNMDDSYVFAFDAGPMATALYPSMKIWMLSLATEESPEGAIEFSLYDEPNDLEQPRLSGDTEVWSYSTTMPTRTRTFSPVIESTLPDLAIATGRGTIASADLNGDGAAEFAVSYQEAAPEGQNYGSDRLRLAHNDGTGQFTMEELPCNAYGQVLWADMDCDADLDLILSSWSNTVVYVNSGAGTFAVSANELPSSGMGGAAVADFNRDGRVDLLLANSDEGLLLMRQLPDGSFEKRAFGRDIPDNFYGVAATGVAAGDVNGDGLSDFIFWQKTGLVLGLNCGDLEFEFRDLPPGGGDGLAMAFGDFNNDGCDDLAWSGGASCGVFQGAGNGWMKAVEFAPSFKPVFGGNVAWGDINNDGSQDLILNGRDRNTTYTTGSNLIDANLGLYGNHFYLLSYTNGYFVESDYELTGISASTRSTLLASLDVDGDGDLDIFSAGYRGITSETKLTIIEEELCHTSLLLNHFEVFTAGETVNHPPEVPTQFSAESSLNQVCFSWSGAMDAETPANGLRYLLEVGTSSGASDLFSGCVGASNIGLLLKNETVLTDLPAGNLYWRVRTVDASQTLSAWSSVQIVNFPGSLEQSCIRIAAADGGITLPEQGEYRIDTGDSINLSAQPAAGYQFDGWLINGSTVSSDSYALTPTEQWTDVIPQFSAKAGAAPEVGEWSRHIVPSDNWYSLDLTDFASVVLNGYLYCFPGNGGDQAWRTSDGVNWQHNSFMGLSWNNLPYDDAVAWSDKIWLVDQATIYSATQGAGGALTWSTKTTSAPWGATYMQLAAFNGKLWAINAYNSASAGSVWSSADGVSWTEEVVAPWSNHPYKRLVVAGDTLLAIISSSSSGTTPGEVWGSSDGVNWTQHCVATPWEHDGSSWNASCFIAAAWFDGAVHVVGTENTHFVSTDNGVSWVKVHPTGSESSHFTAASLGGCEIVVFDGELYLIGSESDQVDGLGSVFWRLAPASGSGETTYTLNMSVDGDSGTTMPPSGIYFDEQGIYPIEARPEPGFEFVSWNGSVADVFDAQTSVSLSSDLSISAIFQPTENELAEPEQISLTTSVFPSGSGSVRLADSPTEAASSVAEDGSTQIQALPEDGWVFSHWRGSSVAQMREQTTAIIPDGSTPVEVTACFRPAAPGSVDAYGNSSAFVDAAGNQWLWGARLAGIDEQLWNSPDGGSIPPFAFNDTVFNECLNSTYMLSGNGTLLRQKNTAVSVSLENSILTFPQYRFVDFAYRGADTWAYALAIDSDGKVWAWGNNAFGQLGDGTQIDRTDPVPVLLPESETFTCVKAGTTFAMALSLSGKVYVWGANSYGQLGSAAEVSPVPSQITALTDIRDIAAGGGHALVLDADGALYGWGSDLYGQASGRRGDDKDTPVLIESLSANMSTHSVQIKMVDAAGHSVQTGSGSMTPEAGSYILRPYAEYFVEALNGDRYQFDHWEGPVVDPSAVQSVAKAMPDSVVTAVFKLHTQSMPSLNLSINNTEAGTLFPSNGILEYLQGEQVEIRTQPSPGWQFDYWLIDGEIVSEPTIELEMNRDIVAQAIYSPQTFRTQPVPEYLNSWGQPTDYEYPSNRSLFNSEYTGPLFIEAAQTSCNGYTRLYLATDGTLWYVKYPLAMEQVPGETAEELSFGNVKHIVSDWGAFMLAVRNDGSIWVWGNVPEQGFVERPVQVDGLDGNDYQQIVAVGNTLLFLHTDGTVSSWGVDTALTGTGVSHSSLTVVSGLSEVAQIVANNSSVLVRKIDGTVWGWGNNYQELLGVSADTLNASNLPVQVNGLSNIANLFPGGFAVDNQGRTWVWGRNSGSNKGLGISYANQSILPPMIHPSFPSNVVSVSLGVYTGIVCDDGSIWRAGNAVYWNFTQLTSDTYTASPVYRNITVTATPEQTAWISHAAGTYTYLENDQVLLWADPPLTVQCDGWLIDGLLVSSPAVNLLMDGNRTVEPLFSLRPVIELPAPELCIGSAVVDQNKQNQVVRLPITLSGQDYIVPDALQFIVQVPGELSKPELTLSGEWDGLIDIISETEVVGTNEDWNVKVLMTGSNDVFSVSNMTLATLNFDMQGVSTGDYPVCILDAESMMLPVASEDDGAIAIPLNIADGMLLAKTSERCAVKLHLSAQPTAVSCLTDDEMETLSDWGSLRQDLNQYAEVWLKCGANEELYNFSYNLSISGSASFTTNYQYFINEDDLNVVVSPDGSTLTSLGGPVSDEKIISHNDFAANTYESGEWILVARMPLDGSGGSSLLSMTDINVELFEEDGNENFLLPDQTRSVTVAPNAAPTSSDISISTTSADFVRIYPEINDVNPQDLDGISLVLLRYPVSGNVLIDPADPHGFIYHPPENGVFSGIVSFQFALSDGTDVSETYTAEITVNNPSNFVGIEDVIHCGSDTNLSLSIQVSDTDTPASQLVFALHNAPHWLSIVNNDDGTAVISGIAPPTRDSWQVFAVQVFDPLSRTTSQATVLLTFDPAEGGVLLTVINGSGSGLFEENDILQISARDPETGEQFTGWEGDVECLDDAQSLTPTVTLPGHDITLTAVFSSASDSSGFSDWADSYGLVDGQNALTDTPAGDGISNLEKYAFGLNPEQAYNAGSLFSMRIDSSSQQMILRYEKSKQAADVRITPVWTPSLTDQEWLTSSIVTNLVGETDTHEIWDASLPLTGGSGFMRLRFELVVPAAALTFTDWVDSYDLASGEDGPSDTPADDGVSNLEKYAYGLNPGEAASPSTLFTMQIDGATQSFVLHYEKSKQTTDVQITPIWTSSLTDPDWRSTDFETTRVGETDTHELWKASIPLTTASQLFVRLQFSIL